MRATSDPVDKRTPAVPDPGPENLIPYEPPPPPEHLGQFGALVWREVWALGEGVYNTTSDVYVIERYATLQERRRRLLDQIGDDYLGVGSQGQDVLNPLVRVVQDIEGKLGALEAVLGLSPEARLRLGISAAEAKSKLDEFLQD